jgi:hypothetical protein
MSEEASGRGLSMQVQVKSKELSNGLKAVLVCVGDQESMTLPEVVRVFGIHKDTITDHMKSRGLEFSGNSRLTTLELRKHNVISMTGRPPRMVSKEAIRSLVRFISTPETDAIYNQLWDSAEELHTGNTTQALAIVEAKPVSIYQKSIDVITELLDIVKERDATILYMKDYAPSQAKLLGIAARDIVALVPASVPTARAWAKEQKNAAKLDGYVDAGVVTTYMTAKGCLPAQRVGESSKGHNKALFDKAEVEKFWGVKL